MVFCEQVHRRAVTVVSEADRARGSGSPDDAVPATDALVTTAPGVVLACVHAGWGGTVRGVTPAAVAAMTDLGSDPGT